MLNFLIKNIESFHSCRALWKSPQWKVMQAAQAAFIQKYYMILNGAKQRLVIIFPLPLHFVDSYDRMGAGLNCYVSMLLGHLTRNVAYLKTPVSGESKHNFKPTRTYLQPTLIV